MKILAIIGSPRGKSSGYKIVRMIEDRMKSLGEVEFDYLFLKDAKLRPCLGCYACMALGEDKCPLRDDRAAIEGEMLAADGVILSSPVHVLNVSGLMKNFIDRFAYSNHRPRFHRQKILTLANTGGSGTRRTLSSLKNALGGGRVVRGLEIATPPWPQTLRAVAAKARAVDRAAKAFYRACLTIRFREADLLCLRYVPRSSKGRPRIEALPAGRLCVLCGEGLLLPRENKPAQSGGGKARHGNRRKRDQSHAGRGASPGRPGGRSRCRTPLFFIPLQRIHAGPHRSRSKP